MPGLLTWPETEKMTVPPALLAPISWNHSAPRVKIVGTEARVWVLLTVVGRPYSPKLAGNGGLKRGLPGLPSSDSSNPVSSPQM